MFYNITAYGKKTTFKTFCDIASAKKYLNRKKKEGFTFTKDVDGNHSNGTLTVFDGRMNIWIMKPEVE